MIEFRNISFSYENGDESGQLKNINLKIHLDRLYCYVEHQVVAKQPLQD